MLALKSFTRSFADAPVVRVDGRVLSPHKASWPVANAAVVCVWRQVIR